MGKHTEWRRLVKRLRRKRKRRIIGILRHGQEEEEQRKLEQSASYLEQCQRQQEQDEFQAQEEARLSTEAHERWLIIEEEADKRWRELQKKLEEAKEERLRQNALIKLEWEKEQQRLKEIKEQKEREKQEKERQQQLLVESVDEFIKFGGDTPEHLKILVETNPGKPPCPFFQKTASCRFRDHCSRNHTKPGVSRVLLIPNFYSHYSLEKSSEHGDSALEFDNHETYHDFKEFFFDVLPEMETCGRVRQFKVCCNHEPHLKGNVYVEYASTREAVKSFQVFNGRWYGGKQLSVEFCTIDSWKNAICGLHVWRKCPKGNSCNFLHVFKNPKNLFHRADKDEHRTPPPERIYESERRNWRWSESPERLESCAHSEKIMKNGSRSKRSRSRERSHRSHSSRSRRSHKRSPSSSRSSRRSKKIKH